MGERIRAAIAQLQREYPESGPDDPAWLAVLAIVVIASLFWLLETLFADRPGQPKLRGRPGVFTDAVFLFLLAGMSKRLAKVAGGSVAILLLASGMPRATVWVGALPLWVQAISALLVGDFTGYWTHRALHRIPRLWRLHTVHHSSANLDWLAAARVHPLEVVINQTASMIPIFLLGFSPLIVGWYGPFLALYPIFLHANVRWTYGRLGRYIASPMYHRWHHATDGEALDRNFAGLFPFWDRMFGTQYFPEDRKPQGYGVPGLARLGNGLWEQLSYPFR